MRQSFLLLTLGALVSLALAACTDKEPERKAVEPTSPKTKIPWNSQGPAGGGQFNALPQNQYRR
ncbi:MAG: hypothetical protein RLZZ522_170 [Verrucomicrobiota bacterium]|jgi:outer membrane biogenesis lipoprotein LolB